MGGSEVRVLAVARLPFLTMLNGSNVRTKVKRQTSDVLCGVIKDETHTAWVDGSVAVDPLLLKHTD
jgi:hypothetical protein